VRLEDLETAFGRLIPSVETCALIRERSRTTRWQKLIDVLGAGDSGIVANSGTANPLHASTAQEQNTFETPGPCGCDFSALSKSPAPEVGEAAEGFPESVDWSTERLFSPPGGSAVSPWGAFLKTKAEACRERADVTAPEGGALGRRVVNWHDWEAVPLR